MMSAGLTHVNVHVTVTAVTGGPSDRERRYRVTADDREGDRQTDRWGNGSAAVKQE